MGNIWGIFHTSIQHGSRILFPAAHLDRLSSFGKEIESSMDSLLDLLNSRIIEVLKSLESEKIIFTDLPFRRPSWDFHPSGLIRWKSGGRLATVLQKTRTQYQMYRGKRTLRKLKRLEYRERRLDHSRSKGK